MSEIKAIQTRYKGCYFRSRLEARWAVFFDALGWKWNYEAEGYRNGTSMWLPDFHLPEFDCLVEVKADWNTATESDVAKIVEIVDWCRGSEFLYESGCVLLVDQIPHCAFGEGIPAFPSFHYSKGVWLQPAVFDVLGPVVLETFEQSYFDGTWGGKYIHDEFAKSIRSVTRLVDPVLDPRCPLAEGLVKASRAARSARFEHGETPK